MIGLIKGSFEGTFETAAGSKVTPNKVGYEKVQGKSKNKYRYVNFKLFDGQDQMLTQVREVLENKTGIRWTVSDTVRHCITKTSERYSDQNTVDRGQP